ncbi:MAG TPA: hypothetical protein VK540_14930 [Polyangiaceae bacterium]|nr:hypothetical protein [Polyangiaceae bacterium]
MKARCLLTIAVAAITLLAAPTVFANGRFPRAQRLLEEPGHPERLTIAATYGLLVTDDRGKNWSYVCDPAFTFQPMFASDVVASLTVNGWLLVGVQDAITISRDRGCDFTKTLEPTELATSVDDFAFAADGKDVYALVTTFRNGTNVITLRLSQDGGQTWQPIGSTLPAALAHTLDVDPTDKNHLYVTGSSLSSDEKAPALFLTSNDQGATWNVGTIPGTNLDSSPWIAAIHPRDGNKIFVRTDSWKKDANSSSLAGDALLFSEDGGKTWTELLRAGGSDPEVPGAKMLGFALSPDGSTALVGYGDIIDPVRVVDPDGKWVGLYKSSSDGRYSFGAGAPSMPQRLLDVPVTCLSWTSQGIYACLAPPFQGHHLAFSSDPSLAPASFVTLMKANEVQGAPRCCNGRAVNACTWSTDCQVLGACDAGAPTQGGTCDDAGGAGGAPMTDAGRDTGTGGASGDASGGAGGASGGASGGTGGASGGAGGAGATTQDGDGCGCRIFASHGAYERSPAAVLLVGLLARLRRRRALDRPERATRVT